MVVCPSYPPLIQGLLNPGAYPDISPNERVEIIETHISWILLAGKHAYKIKKPVRFAFLDFSTQDLRRHYCLEELRLNRRYSPDLYLDVVNIAGTPEAPRIGGALPVIDHALKMRRFPSDCTFDRMARAHCLTHAHVTALAGTVADFHRAIRSGVPDGHDARAECIDPYIDGNLAALGRQFQRGAMQARLGQFREWILRERKRLCYSFLERLQQGYVRECHGDLHLENVVLLDGHPRLFDGIEFNPDLRWIDTLNDIAFMAMDLETRGLPGHAFAFLNQYLEITGDYQGLRLLDYYKLYRALVRAKVAMIRHEQTADPVERKTLLDRCLNYLDYGTLLIQPKTPLLIITHGFSGSGKSCLAGRLSTELLAFRIRSDVERKRMRPLSDVYASGAIAQVYDRLLELAHILLAHGHHVILDATFLKRGHRKRARELAMSDGARFILLDCKTTPTLLTERIASRERKGDDPSDADPRVLAYQMESAEALDADELRHTLSIDMDGQPNMTELLKTCQTVSRH